MNESLALTAPILNTEDHPNIESLAEQLIIQSLLAFPDCLANHNINPTFFKQTYYNRIYEMITEANKNKEPINPLHFKVKFKTYFQEKEFYSFFDELWKQRDIVLNKNLKHYIDVLTKREFRESFERLKWATPRDRPIVQVVETFIEKSKDLLQKYEEPPQSSFNLTLMELINRAENAAAGIFPHTIKTHYNYLDAALGECVLDDYLVILGAQSGTGKTTFALNWARHIATYQKYSTLYVSLEMTAVRLMQWYMSAATKIPYRSFSDGLLVEQDYARISAVLAQDLCVSPIDIIKTHTDIGAIIKAIRNHVQNTPNCKFVIVDHLHFITWSQTINPTEVVSRATGMLKQLALELKVPILLLSQLLKPQLEDVSRPPHLGLLKGSGSIISDADLIMMLKLNTSKHMGNNTRVIDNYILKNRGGAADGRPIPLVQYTDKFLITGE